MLNSLNNYHVQCRHERIIKSSIDLIAKLEYSMLKESPISRFGMLRAQAHWVRSNPIFRVMQLILHEPTMAIGYSLRMCALHVNSTNPGRSNLVFRLKPIAEAGMSNRLIGLVTFHDPSSTTPSPKSGVATLNPTGLTPMITYRPRPSNISRPVLHDSQPKIRGRDPQPHRIDAYEIKTYKATAELIIIIISLLEG